MRVSQVTKEGSIYNVTLSPNRIERFFGSKDKIFTLHESDLEYVHAKKNTRHGVYIHDNGYLTDVKDQFAEAIDAFKKTSFK